MSTKGRRKFIRTMSRRRKGAKAIAKKALREVNKIKQSIETKWHSIAVTAASVVAGTPVVEHLTDIDQGDSAQLREGNHVNIQSLQIRGAIKLDDPTGVFENELIRIIIFIDKTGEAVRTTVTNLLIAANLVNIRHPVHMNDFRVLMDKTMTLQNLSLNSDTSLKFFQYFKRFKRTIRCKWLDGTGSNPEENQLYFAILVNSNLLANAVSFAGRAMIKFTDL